MALDISTARLDIAKIYIAAFNRAPDASGLDFWTKAYMGGSSLASIANGFASSAEYANKYPSFLTNTEYVAAVYKNVFGRAVDTAGSTYWTAALNAGTLTKASLLNALVSAATASSTNADGMRLNNMADFGVYAAINGVSSTAANSALISITSDSSTLTAAKSAVGTFNTAYALTSSKDVAYGTSSDDTFTGTLDGNNNTLTSGDQIYGGTGTDTLSVTLGNASNFAILATTSGIETIKIEAQSTDATGSQGNTDSNAEHVRVDAEDMSGVSKWTNIDSRATLDIEDVRINSHITTLEWNNADQGSEVDYNVYFNPTNITSPGISTVGGSDTLTITMANVKNIKEGNTDGPLGGFKTVSFLATGSATGALEKTIEVNMSNGVIVVKDASGSIVTDATGVIDTYAKLKSAIDTGINKAGLDGELKVSLGALTDATFSTDVTSTDGKTIYAAKSVAGLYTPIIIERTNNSVKLTEGSITVSQQNQAGNLSYDETPTRPTTDVPSLTQVDVILDNVGRGSKSGDFLAGNMSTGVYSGSKGIQQFNVTVENNSKLATMSSTNNTLEVVNVKNGTTKGALTVNGGSTTNATYGLTDVRVFDASAMDGAVTLTAELTAATTTKYLDLVDTATSPSADNSEIAYNKVTDIEFSYDMGKGNDTLTLDISGSNLNTTGGTTTREDFVMVVNGNDGDDKLNLKIVNPTNDAVAIGSGANWYNNHDLTKNITVNGGNGTDTIRTYGVGDIVINGDAGNDTIYADNTGAKATFVFNTFDQATAGSASRTQDDLRSDTNESYNLAGSKLTVNFKGLTSTIALKYDATKYTVSDLQINQTIKEAINSDAVLSKLLLAQDGPANTLVVTSLIDGVMTTGDLNVSIATPAAGVLTASQITAMGAAYGIVAPTETTVLAALNASLAIFTTNGDYTTNFTNGANSVAGADNNGTNSVSTSDNTITGGAGDDVIVLGTTFGTTTTSFFDDSNDTVVYNAPFGNDTIVHFTTTGAGADTLDFRGLGSSTTVVAYAANVNSSDTLVQSLIKAADTTTSAAASSSVYIVYNGVTGTVYQVNNGVAVGDAVATNVGTIKLAQDQVSNGGQALNLSTGWSTLAGTWTNSKVGLASNDYNINLGTTTPTNPGTGTGTTTATIAITSAGATITDGGSTVNTTYNVSNGTYTQVIAGFGAGDKLAFATGNATASVANTSFTDGSVTVQSSNASSGTTVTITLTGLTNAQDAALNSAADFNTLFGAGTIA